MNLIYAMSIVHVLILATAIPSKYDFLQVSRELVVDVPRSVSEFFDES